MKFLSAAALAACVALSTAAFADSYNFTVTGSGGGFSGSGVLTTSTDANPGGNLITGITGSGVTGLLATSAFNNNDNYLFLGYNVFVDTKGFAFTDTMDGQNYTVDVYSANGSYWAAVKDSDGTITTDPVTLDVSTGTSGTGGTSGTPAPTPEPSSLMLLGSGVLGVAGALRRRMPAKA